MNDDGTNTLTLYGLSKVFSMSLAVCDACSVSITLTRMIWYDSFPNSIAVAFLMGTNVQ